MAVWSIGRRVPCQRTEPAGLWSAAPNESFHGCTNTPNTHTPPTHRGEPRASAVLAGVPPGEGRPRQHGRGPEQLPPPPLLALPPPPGRVVRLCFVCVLYVCGCACKGRMGGCLFRSFEPTPQMAALTPRESSPRTHNRNKAQPTTVQPPKQPTHANKQPTTVTHRATTPLPLNLAEMMDLLLTVHGHQVLIDGCFNGDPHPGNKLEKASALAVVSLGCGGIGPHPGVLEKKALAVLSSGCGGRVG